MEKIDTMMQMHKELETLIQKYQDQLTAGEIASNLGGMLVRIAQLTGLPEDRFLGFMKDLFAVDPDSPEEMDLQ